MFINIDKELVSVQLLWHRQHRQNEVQIFLWNLAISRYQVLDNPFKVLIGSNFQDLIHIVLHEFELDVFGRAIAEIKSDRGSLDTAKWGDILDVVYNLRPFIREDIQVVWHERIVLIVDWLDISDRSNAVNVFTVGDLGQESAFTNALLLFLFKLLQ